MPRWCEGWRKRRWILFYTAIPAVGCVALTPFGLGWIYLAGAIVLERAVPGLRGAALSQAQQGAARRCSSTRSGTWRESLQSWPLTVCSSAEIRASERGTLISGEPDR